MLVRPLQVEAAMRRLALVAWFFWLALVGSQVFAAEIRGQGDPSFQAALAMWLDGDDAAALPQLAALAADDNRAAQLLLGLIDMMPPLQGPCLAALPRAERS
jgi:hypothetical protein